MRWPWELVPWRRSRGVDGPDAPAGDADPPPGPATRAPVEAAPSSTGLPAAWTRLPPLQRSVADSTAVAPPAAFRSSLTTHQNPSLLAPLGHLVDPDGPAGVVGGLASSVGGPIAYEGADELRVPARPAPTAPAVQRRVATLQPTATPAPDVSQQSSGGPAFLPESPPTGSTPTGSPPTGSTDPGATHPGSTHPGSTDPGGATPASLPSVVQRSVSAPADPTVLGAGELSASATDRHRTLDGAPPPVSTPDRRPDPAPLTVPVQRAATSAADATSGSPRPIAGHVSPTLRPVVPPATGGDGSAVVSPAVGAVPTPGPPAPADDELVVARSAAEPTAGSEPWSGGDPGSMGPVIIEPAPAAGDDVVGLVADRSPLPSSSSFVASELPQVATDGPAPLTVATPSTAPPPAPSVQRSGPTQPPSSSDRGPADGSTTSTRAQPSAAATPPRLPAGLDEQGYPPLIARSVQRAAAADHPDTSSGPTPSSGAASTPDSAESQAPLSPFSAAISALRDTTEEPPVASTTTQQIHDATREPDLVVARRVAPDAAGLLPPAAVHLQRTDQIPGHHRGRGPDPVQRNLIAGHSPFPSALHTLTTGTTIPPAPAVQRLRYEGATSAGPRQVDRPGGPRDPSGSSQVAVPTGMDVAPASLASSGEVSRSDASSGPSPSAGASWSVQRQPAGTAGGTGSTYAPAPGDRPAAAPFPPVRLDPVPAGSRGAGTPAAPTTPFASTPTVLSGPGTSSAAPGTDELPLLQRRFDAPAPSSAGSAPLAPPASADPPPMAVSSRTVGLAEMFALAAAQSSDGVAVQRSAEVEVQPASVDSAPAASSAGSSAAPAGPAAPAAPLSGAELEEMARRLYEPLSARLRTELWQDRERSGLLTDLRP